MSNGTPTPPPPAHHPIWQADHPVWKIIRDLVIFIASIVAASFGISNHSKIQDVEQRQNEAATTATEVKQQLEVKSAEDAKKAGVSLYSDWKYLQDVADTSGSPRDEAAAAEAKRLYEAHVRKNGSAP